MIRFGDNWGGNASFTKKEMFWQFGKKEVKSSLKKKGRAWLRLLKPLIRAKLKTLEQVKESS